MRSKRLPCSEALSAHVGERVAGASKCQELNWATKLILPLPEAARALQLIVPTSSLQFIFAVRRAT